MGPNLYIFVNEPDAVNAVLRSKVCLEKPDIYDAVRHVLGGNGLFTAKGEHWRVHRKLIAPALNDSTLSQHTSIVNHYIRNFCATEFAAMADKGEPFDILEPLNVCLLETFLDATFGMEWKYKAKYSQLFQVLVR